jgi:hypothetical protein
MNGNNDGISAVAQSTINANRCLVVKVGHVTIVFLIGIIHPLDSFGHRPDWRMCISSALSSLRAHAKRQAYIYHMSIFGVVSFFAAF